MPNFRLGRKAVKRDSRTLMLSRYTSPSFTPPESCDWTRGVLEWGMMLNDKLGCCTIAGVAHAIQVWSMNAGTETTLPDSTVLNYYEKWDGYVVGDPNTDEGGIELDVLNNWRKQGFSGHSLLAFADPDVKNINEVKQSISLFGGSSIGLQVPQSVMDSNDDPTISWDVTGDDSDCGGHCVYAVSYDANTVGVISWGKVYKMTWRFWLEFVDEAHALLSPDFIAQNGLDPQGFNLSQLQADLANIR